MTETRTRPHIQVPNELSRTVERYTPHGGGNSDKPSPPSIGRPAHAAALESSIESAVIHAKQRRTTAGFSVTGAKPGVYLEFESLPGWPLAVASMERRLAKDPHKHIEVVAVSEQPTRAEGADSTTTQHAVVFVPDGEVSHFLQQLEKYALTTEKKERERRHENLYDRIADLRLATLQALWTDDQVTYPSDENEPFWWEVWLRCTDGNEFARLHEFASHTEIRLGERRIQFGDRIVTLVRASARQLSASLDVLNDLAELRRAKETATFFLEQDNTDQAGWAQELAGRIEHVKEDASVICILDTGVNFGHPLLSGSLVPADCHAVDPNWGTHDHDGHGTAMAGLALYGDLFPLLAGTGPVLLGHRLESVKILPPIGANEPSLYAAVTAEAASRPEIEAPARRRVFSMAVTASDNREGGLPTSWSAAIDALAAGRSFDSSSKGLLYFDDYSPRQRLFVVSAGNIDRTSLEHGHVERSDTEPVDDPAQAWNALTVGAHTEKVDITDPSWRGWFPLAARGELSPWSTTSVTFERQWPLKPDVVMEGGNVVHNDAGQVDFPCDDLNLLTTHHTPSKQSFAPSWGTSAATAQAARLCGAVSAAYPDLWPETIRGLVVHSAEWTPIMKASLDAESSKTRRVLLVRRYGFGVPSLDRALKSAKSAVTLMVQDSIRPFVNGRMREIHLHDLPWPRDVLRSLGHVDVRLRVTLSYFVEPNPGRRGWQSKYRYQSHGLRFEVKQAAESIGEFRKRLNKTALDEDEGRPRSGGSDDWYLGPIARNRGSLHADMLFSSAADLAERGVIAVFPVTGWWKELKGRDRSDHGARYSLVVSIETDRTDVDIWTPIATAVSVPVESVVG